MKPFWVYIRENQKIVTFAQTSIGAKMKAKQKYKLEYLPPVEKV